MRLAKALKLTTGCGIVGAVAATFLTVATVQFAAPTAEATPAMAKGKPCTSCHVGGSPSKANVKKKKKKKKKRSELWPHDETDIAIAHSIFR